MLKPSYAELMDILNEGSETDVTSRYTVVIAAAKRARQLIDGDEPMVESYNGEKPVSIAVEEIKEGKIKVVPEGHGTVINPKKSIEDEIKEELQAQSTEELELETEDTEDVEEVSEEVETEE